MSTPTTTAAAATATATASSRAAARLNVKPPVATILVLGAGGLFGSKLCTLLGRVIPQQQFHNPHLSNNQVLGQGTDNKIRIVVAGRRADVVNKYSIFFNERLVKENCKQNSYALEYKPAVIDVSKAEEFTKAMNDLQPTMVVNASGIQKEALVRLARTCVVNHGVHFIDLCDDFESIQLLEKEMKSVKKLEIAVTEQNKKLKPIAPLVLCATGVSTSPTLTGAMIEDVLLENNTFRNLQELEPDENDEPNNTNQVDADSSSSGNTNNNTASAHQREKNITPKRDKVMMESSPSVEIYLTPGMKTHNNDQSFEGQINLEQGVGTTHSLLRRIGEKFNVIRDNGKIVEETETTSFRKLKKMILPPPLGKRFTSPMASPDVLLNSKASNLTFFAGLQVPLVHRIVAALPSSVAKKFTDPGKSWFVGRAFRLAGNFGEDSGGLLVKIKKNNDKGKQYQTESVFLKATKGAGVYVPAIPAVTLVVKLLQNTAFHDRSVPNSLLFHEMQLEMTMNNKNDSANKSEEHPVVIFSNGAQPNRVRTIEKNGKQIVPMIPEGEQSHLLPTMMEIQQLIDDTMLDITFEQTRCLFQWAIDGHGSRKTWDTKVHPAVRKFHELQGDNIKLVGFVESPVPKRFIDKVVHTVLRLQHSMEPNTKFDFTLTAEPYHEAWTRIYPTGTMYGEMEACEVVYGKFKKRREARCFREKMFGGLVHLYHVPRVDESTGFIHFDCRRVTALFGLLDLPPILAPSVKAIEGVCPVTGRFQFDVESKLPIVGTLIKYKGTIRVEDGNEEEEKSGK